MMEVSELVLVVLTGPCASGMWIVGRCCIRYVATHEVALDSY